MREKSIILPEHPPTIAFLPQAIKIWRSKSTKDVSLAMFVCFCAGVVLWVIYGFMEAINSLVQAAKAKARGYRSTRNLKAIIYLIAGKLELQLPT